LYQSLLGRSGAILEIFEPDYYPENADPYQASKIALMQIGMLINEFIL